MANNRPLTEKQQLWAKLVYTIGGETFGNAYQSAIKAGYTESTAKVWSAKWLEDIRFIAEKNKIQAKTRKILEHDRDIAIKLLSDNLARLQTKADAGDVQAASAITACIRELNSISALHSNTIITDDAVHELDEAEAEDRRAFTAWQLRQQLAVKQA